MLTKCEVLHSEKKERLVVVENPPENLADILSRTSRMMGEHLTGPDSSWSGQGSRRLCEAGSVLSSACLSHLSLTCMGKGLLHRSRNSRTEENPRFTANGKVHPNSSPPGSWESVEPCPWEEQSCRLPPPTRHPTDNFVICVFMLEPTKSLW